MKGKDGNGASDAAVAGDEHTAKRGENWSSKG